MSDSPDYTVADDLAVALTLAAEADLIAMDRYRSQDLGIQLKADKSIVTDADTRVERMIRDHLAEARPHDAVLGEEFGDAGSSHRRWIVDPIDGTSNFARGVPIWGALIALVVDEVPVVGVVSAPALGRRWWGATGHGAWVQEHGGEPRRIRVSAVDALEDATLSYNNLQTWDQYGHLDHLVALSRSVGRTRAFGDLWSYMLLAEGAIDVAGEFDVKPWDIAALVPVVTEAGGRVTSASGSSSLSELSVIASNGVLHDAVLTRLRG
ncbi:inositol monophosphatase family protein [Protaetiibacter intestinalis]|uniref:Histidinol-phosphatase n=1 Tax=Protaetiibacter intestinalis TaxID=2419774 RepID=A0A387BAI9_9MICO|nr:inositol monophosphatase family protein [Protaetiibacter intestinalis]AYF98728.1 histidinol phosphatase [Protaetiibacter intestinalis]